MRKKQEKLTSARISTLFSNYVPISAVPYCLELWLQYPFLLKITRKRKTKHGDYRFHKGLDAHTITVNSNLNPYAFLITYIHEVAHLVAFQKHSLRIAPHGKEWKKCFQELMQPLLMETVFPSDILIPLSQHMRSPKASSSTDPRLVLALHHHDLDGKGMTLDSLPLSQTFRFHERVFTKDEVKRTRAWCTEVKTGRRYTIPITALVEVA